MVLVFTHTQADEEVKKRDGKNDPKSNVTKYTAWKKEGSKGYTYDELFQSYSQSQKDY